MIRTVISFIPFMVSLFWFIIYALSYRRHNPAKKILTWFLLTCTILYLCHALFFTSGAKHSTECIWALCSLSVYPIYYLYIRALTRNVSKNPRQYCILIPGILVFALMVFRPGETADLLRLVLLSVQIVFVCISGIIMLRNFDKEVASCYANVESHNTTDIKILLIAFVFTSCLSAAANIIGKATVANEDRLLIPLALLFATMIFALSYIGYTRPFSYKEFSESIDEDNQEHPPKEPDEILGEKLEELMNEKHLYLEKNLKITDVASQIGSCRTYLSNYINQVKGESFSDYINRLRIEYAKTVLANDADTKNIILAETLGFSNEQSFYRNFKKFTGMTPSEWKNAQSLYSNTELPRKFSGD